MEILRVNIKSLKFFLLWPRDNASRTTNIIISILYHTVIFISSLPTISAIGYQIAVGIEHIDIILESVIGCGDYVGFIVIYACFQTNIPKIKRTIRKTSDFLIYCEPSVIEEAEKEVRFYTIGSMIYFAFGLTINSVLPLVDYKSCNERRPSDYYRKHDPCGMSSRIWLPFELNNQNYLYVLSFTHNHACVHIAFAVLGITMLLIGLLIHITAQIKNLRRHILNVFNSETTESDSDELALHMERKLKFCIRYHNAIIEYTNEVFESFNMMLVVHVCFTSIILAIISYQILSFDNFMDKLRYFLHMMGWVGMLFVTCFYGQVILDESTTIAEAAYQSEWYNGPVRLRKMICLMIVRSQRPLLLKVASIGVVSLETFVSVIKTAYSYFALLLTIAE